MPYDPHKHHRRSIRLKDYDYASAGAYFVTICLQGRSCLLGQVEDGEMVRNAAGEMVAQQWLALSQRFPSADLDAFVVMPNHVHGIIVIHDDPPVGAGLVPAQDTGVPTMGAPVRRAPTRGAPFVSI